MDSRFTYNPNFHVDSLHQQPQSPGIPHGISEILPAGCGRLLILILDEWQLEIMQMDEYCYIIRQFYNSYKILDQNLQSVFTSVSEHIENDSNAAFMISTQYSPKGYPAGIVISTLFTVLLVEPITYTASLRLATSSNHRITISMP